MNRENINIACEQHAEEILTRCRKTVKMWRDVYETLGLEFELRDPTVEQYAKAIEIQFKLMKKPKKTKKD